jgi:DNA invertase Pin-like site-specific DNA recombinase
VSGLLIGYARVSTDEQDLTAQRDALTRSVSRPTGSTSTTA